MKFDLSFVLIAGREAAQEPLTIQIERILRTLAQFNIVHVTTFSATSGVAHHISPKKKLTELYGDGTCKMRYNKHAEREVEGKCRWPVIDKQDRPQQDLELGV